MIVVFLKVFGKESHYQVIDSALFIYLLGNEVGDIPIIRNLFSSYL